MLWWGHRGRWKRRRWNFPLGMRGCLVIHRLVVEKGRGRRD